MKRERELFSGPKKCSWATFSALNLVFPVRLMLSPFHPQFVPELYLPKKVKLRVVGLRMGGKHVTLYRM